MTRRPEHNAHVKSLRCLGSVPECPLNFGVVGILINHSENEIAEGTTDDF